MGRKVRGMRHRNVAEACCHGNLSWDRCRAMVHTPLGSPPGDRRERKPMKRIAFVLGLAALFASTSASAIKVPTGNTDYDLNVSVLLQARYEGTFEASTEKAFDSDF